MKKCIGKIFSICFTSLFLIAASAGAGDPDNDNTPEQAKVIILNDENPTPGNFDKPGDQDWVKFFGLSGRSYRIEVTNNCPECDIDIKFYKSGLTAVPETGGNGIEGDDEYLNTGELPQDGIYYVQIYNSTDTSGDDAKYGLKVRLEHAPAAAPFRGTVSDAFSRAPLGDVMIKTSSYTHEDDGFSALSDESGYVICHTSLEDSDTYSLEEDSVNLTAQFPGYRRFEMSVFMIGEEFRIPPEADDGGTISPRTARDTVNSSDLIEWKGEIELIPLYRDINGDGNINLSDAVAVLKVLAGRKTDLASGTKKTGMEELIYLLQYIAKND